ncbi:3-oxoadipate enol-lactonase [Rhodobacter sp. Har01]|uniref:3-oxoadipate enol-lactonase n=1 Tax=Rhodobacter sp. Har01 TaxID=2883999 RepID=UPI001D08CD7C|nr:3-oxoadipate enol-lactonase [Rhodobacter sp. Har01]MCB6178226.1 3-oxoadipate enol-lactonase [Rhodobacter sp. Har01]
MPPVFLPDLRLNARLDGPEGAPPLVFVNALGTDLSIWDDIIACLPAHRILRFDARGHGASDVPPAPYAMGTLIRDAERLMDHFGLKGAVVVGLSIGGLVAQGLAVKRSDLVRGMVLSNTAARIGTAEQWQARIASVRDGGLAAIAEATMERWFGRKWRDTPAMPRLRDMLLACPVQGWMGCAAAIAGTDFYQTTATLRLPTLALAGANDGSTPPDLVRETADLIPGSRFQLIRGAGHLPFAEQPEAYATALRTFLTEIGHD